MAPGCVCVCVLQCARLCRALDEQMGVDELREAWREGMADVCISLMWSYVSPSSLPLNGLCVLKKKRNHHADELDVDADVAKSRLVVTSAHVNSSINGTYGICREDFNSPNGSLNVYLSWEMSNFDSNNRGITHCTTALTMNIQQTE